MEPESFNDWGNGGEATVEASFKESQATFLSNNGQLDPLHEDFLGYKRLLYALCDSVVEGAVDTTGHPGPPNQQWHSTLTLFLKKHLPQDDENETCASALVDVFWLTWMELEAGGVKDRKKRFVALAKECVTRQVVTASLLKERLQEPLLEALGLIQSSAFFKKAQLRYKTQMYYRQTKFQLLREEPEGFAKLVTTLHRFFSQPPAQANLAEARQEVLELIGYFDLDPNRVIDIVLECYERAGYRASGHRPHLVALLQLFEPSSVAQILGFKFRQYHVPAAAAAKAASHSSPSSSKLKSSKATKDDKASAKAAAATAKAAEPVTPPPTVPAPKSLYTVSAHLIGSGVVDLFQLLPHLNPPDEEVLALRQRTLDDCLLAARKATTVSLAGRARAGDAKSGAPSASPALPSSSSSGGMSMVEEELKAAEEKKQLLLENVCVPSPCHPLLGNDRVSHHQKFELLLALLKFRAYKPAQTLLQRYEQCVPASDPRIALELCIMATAGIAPYYAPIIAGHFNLLKPPPKSSSSSSPPSSAPGKREVPNYLEAPKAIAQALKHVGLYLYRDPVLFVKICRVLRKTVKTLLKAEERINNANLVKRVKEGVGFQAAKPSPTPKELQTVPQDVIEVLGDFLLPALTLLDSNCSLNHELWNVVRYLSYDNRYRLYGYWKDKVYLLPECQLARAHTIARSRYLLKRIAGNKAKECGRLLGKFSNSNPLVAFDVILKQVQSFDNMIEPVVDALRYMPPLCYDILTFTLVSQLSPQPGKRSKLKNDGMNESGWFQALCGLTGHYLRKHPDIDLVPILQLVANQLKAQNSLDLLLLRELITKMVGLDSTEEIGDTQLEGQAGGRTLQTETAVFRTTKNKKRPTAYLMDAVEKQNLVFPLFCLLGQQKAAIVFQTETQHIELLGQLYDKCSSTVAQFVEFTSLNTTSDSSYASNFPTLFAMCTEYGLAPCDAFHAVRRCLHLPKVSHPPPEALAINQAAQTKREAAQAAAKAAKAEAEAAAAAAAAAGAGAVIKAEEEEAAGKETNPAAAAAEPESGTTAMKDEEGTAAAAAPGAAGGDKQGQGEASGETTMPTAVKVEKGGEGGSEGGSGEKEEGETAASPLAAAEAAAGPEPPTPLVQTCRALLPEETWLSISPEFYAMFWSLSNYDLHVPEAAYDKEVKRVKGLMATLGKTAGGKAAGSTGAKAQKERDKLAKVLINLENEKKAQLKNHASVMATLKAKAGTFLVDVQNRNATVTKFLQHCVMPRCFTSANDALYCVRFIDSVHQLDVPFFSVIHLYDQIFKSTLSLINSCTIHEASRLGRFLHAALQKLLDWKKSQTFYEKNCSSKSSFATDFYKPKGERLPFKKFLLILERWHNTWMQKVFPLCLGDKATNHQKMNTVRILSRIGTVFPRIKKHGAALEELIGKIVQDKAYKDTALKLNATRCQSLLLSERKNWVDEYVFCQKPRPKKAVSVKTKAAKPGAAKGTKGDKPVTKQADKRDKKAAAAAAASASPSTSSNSKDKDRDKGKDKKGSSSTGSKAKEKQVKDKIPKRDGGKDGKEASKESDRAKKTKEGGAKDKGAKDKQKGGSKKERKEDKKGESEGKGREKEKDSNMEKDKKDSKTSAKEKSEDKSKDKEKRDKKDRKRKRGRSKERSDKRADNGEEGSSSKSRSRSRQRSSSKDSVRSRDGSREKSKTTSSASSSFSSSSREKGASSSREKGDKGKDKAKDKAKDKGRDNGKEAKADKQGKDKEKKAPPDSDKKKDAAVGSGGKEAATSAKERQAKHDNTKDMGPPDSKRRKGGASAASSGPATKSESGRSSSRKETSASASGSSSGSGGGGGGGARRGRGGQLDSKGSKDTKDAGSVGAASSNSRKRRREASSRSAQEAPTPGESVKRHKDKHEGAVPKQNSKAAQDANRPSSSAGQPSSKSSSGQPGGARKSSHKKTSNPAPHPKKNSASSSSSSGSQKSSAGQVGRRKLNVSRKKRS